jgi:hypothetical protein
VKHGFKTEAERMALRIRAEIGHDESERLDLLRLRQHFGVELVTLADLADRCPEAVAHLHGEGASDFSAALLVVGDYRLLVVNATHSRGRLANSIAHELAHLILGHAPNPGFDLLGLRHWPEDDEAEADWLAGCLLAPRSGLIAVMTRLSLRLPAAADHYGISIELMRQRWHQTGCAKQVERAAAKRMR